MIFAGMLNATMDVLKVHFKKSIFSTWKYQNWINPALSWHNKWRPKTKFGDLIMSTVLVGLTDMWHFVKMLMILTLSATIVFYSPLFKWYFNIPILYFAFTGTFELFFSRILIKKQNNLA